MHCNVFIVEFQCNLMDKHTTENQPLGDVIMCIINLTYLVLKSEFLEIRLFLKNHASPPSLSLSPQNVLLESVLKMNDEIYQKPGEGG